MHSVLNTMAMSSRPEKLFSVFTYVTNIGSLSNALQFWYGKIHQDSSIVGIPWSANTISLRRQDALAVRFEALKKGDATMLVYTQHAEWDYSQNWTSWQ